MLVAQGDSQAYEILGQIISGIPQPMFQVIGPLYSETWFDLKGRTTATMLLSVGSSLIMHRSQKHH